MSLITENGSYEWNLIQGSVTYDKSNFSTGTLSDALFQTFGIGNVAARQLNLTMWNCPLNTAEPLKLVCNAMAYDGTVTVIPKGTYFIDTIETSPYSEFAEIVAFDAMLKTEVVYVPAGGTWTAKTASTVVSDIASDIGVTVETDTLNYIKANDFTFTTPPKIGANGTTEREMLSYIGIILGGNWTIDDNNQLRLVLVTEPLYVPKLVIVGSDGKFYAERFAYLDGTEDVVAFDTNGKSQVIGFSEVTNSTVLLYLDRNGMFQSDTFANIQSVAEEDSAVEIGDEVVDFNISPDEVVKRIELVVDNQTYYRSPSGLSDAQWDALGGRCISAELPIMASQSVADSLYEKLNGLIHIPYDSRSAYFSPDVRLGRVLHIKDQYVVLADRTLTIDPLAASDLRSEPEQRLQSFYPYISPEQRQTARNIGEAAAAAKTAGEAASAAQASANAAAAAASSAQSTANGASSRQQYIYRSVPSGTVPGPNTTWVTETAAIQNAWTTTRPEYSASYPVLYIAIQRQTVAQASGTSCSCTTPVIDETTTVIDGGHITTGTIDANVVTVANINASNINTGTLSADRIGANSISVGKLTGTISNGDWKLDLNAGTLTIGDISADKVTTGTMSAARIKGGTLTLGGAGNANGTMELYDASGNLAGRWNNSGVYIKGGEIYQEQYINATYGTAWLRMQSTTISGGYTGFNNTAEVDLQNTTTLNSETKPSAVISESLGHVRIDAVNGYAIFRTSNNYVMTPQGVIYAGYTGYVGSVYFRNGIACGS